METQAATVVTVDGRLAVVAVDARAVCPRCAEGRGCGAGLFAGARERQQLELPVARGVGLLQPGERVLLALPAADLLRASACAYGLPLGGMLAALAAGWLIAGPLPDPAAIVAASAGLAGGVLLGRRLLERRGCLQGFEPLIVGRAPE